MPKPTVRLERPPTAAGPGTAVTSAPVRTAVLEEEDEGADEKTLNILAIVGLVLAAILMLVVLFSSDEFGLAVDRTGTSTSFLKFPAAEPGHASATIDAEGETHFKSNLTLKAIPVYEGAAQ
jgi:hypothetical protein